MGCEAQEGKHGRGCEWEWRKRWVLGICGGQRASPELVVRYKVDPGGAAHRILRSARRAKTKKKRVCVRYRTENLCFPKKEIEKGEKEDGLRKGKIFLA